MKLSRFFRLTVKSFLSILLLLPPAIAAEPDQPALTGQASTSLGRPRIGLALGGGGTRGVAHLAVIRELEKNHIPIDCIAGTSMGAIVGGLYCAGLTTDEIEAFFKNKSMVRSYDTVPIFLRVTLVPIFAIPHVVFHNYDGLYRGHKFAKYINERVPSECKNIEHLKIPFCAVASNLLDGQPAALTSGNLGRALQASSAIPELRKPVIVGDKLLVDGGVVANLPVDQCRAMGADIVIAVDVDEQLVDLENNHFRKIGTVPYRCLNMHLSAIDAPQLSRADLRIHPDVAGIELLSRSLKDMDLAMIAGQKATEQAIPAIQALINKKLANTSRESEQ
jgi:NTE family protein